jgi:hypothetical protein
MAHSAVECINTAFDVWLSIQSNINDSNISSTDLDKAAIIDLSIKNRLLVVPPEYYFCLIQSAYEFTNAQSANISSIKKYFELNCKNSKTHLLDKFKKSFFQYRNLKLERKSDVEWVNENPPTSFIKSLFQIIKPFEVEILIISRKNFVALDKWVTGSGYKIHSIFGNEQLVKFKNNKFNLISNLQQENQMQKSIFIDDTLDELYSEEWNNIGVMTIEAGWGYNKLQDNSSETIQIINGLLNDLHNRLHR